MVNEGNYKKDNVINLKRIRFRRKYKWLFMFINKLSGIFKKKNRHGDRGKEVYPKTVNH